MAYFHQDCPLLDFPQFTGSVSDPSQQARTKICHLRHSIRPSLTTFAASITNDIRFFRAFCWTRLLNSGAFPNDLRYRNEFANKNNGRKVRQGFAMA